MERGGEDLRGAMGLAGARSVPCRASGARASSPFAQGPRRPQVSDRQAPDGARRRRNRRAPRFRTVERRRVGGTAGAGLGRVISVLGRAAAGLAHDRSTGRAQMGRSARRVVGCGAGRCPGPLHPLAVGTHTVLAPRPHGGRGSAGPEAARVQHDPVRVGRRIRALAERRGVTQGAMVGAGRAGDVPPPPEIGAAPLRLGDRSGSRPSALVEPRPPAARPRTAERQVGGWRRRLSGGSPRPGYPIAEKRALPAIWASACNPVATRVHAPLSPRLTFVPS